MLQQKIIFKTWDFLPQQTLRSRANRNLMLLNGILTLAWLELEHYCLHHKRLGLCMGQVKFHLVEWKLDSTGNVLVQIYVKC